MTLRRILRVFVLAPAKSQAGIKANSVKGGAMRKADRFFSNLAEVAAPVSKNFPKHYDFAEFDPVDRTCAIDDKFNVGAHTPDCQPPLERRMALDLASELDAGVMDDVLLFQYDHPKPWYDLPQHLRDANRADGRFWNSHLIRAFKKKKLSISP